MDNLSAIISRRYIIHKSDVYMNMNDLSKIVVKKLKAKNGFTYDLGNNTLEIHNEAGTVERTVAYEELPTEVQQIIDENPNQITM